MDLLMRSARTLLLALLIFLPLGARGASAAPAAPAVAPPVDREAAERFFLSAYDFFLQNRPWNCLDRLSDTQKKNTYFIDAYYLRSLAMRRLGRYPDAMEAMKAYLEVRQSDHRAQIILTAMEEEWRVLGEMLRPSKILTELLFKSNSLNSLFGIPVHHPLAFSGMSGLGKLSAFERYLFAPDTLGNNFWVFDMTAKSPMMQLPIASPVVAVPLSPQELLLLQKSGDVQSIRIDRTAHTLSPRRLGHIEANVADAAVVSATLMAVADRTGQSVKFHRLPLLGEVASWRPEGEGNRKKLFEPIALAAYGPLLAVADRGNGVVYVLDSYTLVVRDRFEVEMPRDLEWGGQGELYVLTENGELYSHYSAEGKPGDAVRAVRGLTQAWSLAWTREGPIAADVSGRGWWSSRLLPAHEKSIGMVSLREPWIEGKKGEETLFLRGRVSSVYPDFIMRNKVASDAVWRNEVRSMHIAEAHPMAGGAVVFYSPAGDSGDPARQGFNKARAAGTFDEIWADLAASSRAGDALPSVIVLDTRVEVPEDRLSILFSFLLHQGIRLDLHAAGRPASAQMTYLSRSTGGNTYYAENVDAVPESDGVEWIVSVPLPPETVSFGFPTDATLSLFASVGVIRFDDWVPIWPSLVKRK